MVTAFELDNSLNRYLNLLLITKREDEEAQGCAGHAQTRHPPDVPDQREAGDDGKEGIDKADRAVLGHLDRLIFARLIEMLRIPLRLLLGNPKGVSPGDMRQDRKIPRRWWRCRGPFESPSVPRIVADAQLFTGADRDNELNDLARDTNHDDGDTDRRHNEEGLPALVVI